MCIAAMKNITAALRARDALARAGIGARVVSIDASLTRNGCAYGVSFPCEKEGELRRILKRRNIEHGLILGSSEGF